MEDTKLGALSHLYRIRANEKGFTLSSFIAYVYIYCQTLFFTDASQAFHDFIYVRLLAVWIIDTFILFRAE